jgi:hypothetical protein
MVLDRSAVEQQEELEVVTSTDKSIVNNYLQKAMLALLGCAWALRG